MSTDKNGLMGPLLKGTGGALLGALVFLTRYSPSLAHILRGAAGRPPAQLSAGALSPADVLTATGPGSQGPAQQVRYCCSSASP